MGHLPFPRYFLRNLVFFRISPYHLNTFAQDLTHGVPNFFRRCAEEVPYISPALIFGLSMFSFGNYKHEQLKRKKPGEFDNEQFYDEDEGAAAGAAGNGEVNAHADGNGNGNGNGDENGHAIGQKDEEE